MSDVDAQDPRQERANALYWDSDESVNQIAETLDLSKGTLYGLIRPRPAGVDCPRCQAEMEYANRTARDRSFLTCPSCGLEEEEETVEALWSDAGEAGAALPPPGPRTASSGPPPTAWARSGWRWARPFWRPRPASSWAASRSGTDRAPPVPTNVRDPRTIITPDAFEIDPALLGLPLAPPARRFWAMVVDLVVVGVLTAVLSNVKLLLWGVIGLVLVRVALKKTRRSTAQAAGVVLQVAVGCLGLTVLVVVLIVFAFAHFSGAGDRVREALDSKVQQAVERGDIGGAALGLDAGLDQATTPAEARRAMERALGKLEDAPLSASTKRLILKAAVPSDASWRGQADSLITAAMADAGQTPPLPEPPAAGVGRAAETPVDSASGTAGPPAPPSDTTAPDLTGMSPAEVATEYASLTRAGADAGDPRYRAVERRLAALVAADTLQVLQDRLVDVQGDLEAERAVRRDMEKDAGTARSGGAAFVALLRDIWNQLGSAIGLWSLYFTATLALWNGQTVGKRLTGVRVLRLEGGPMGWWTAFERAGGYVAGIATGLLGFAQVLWDPNRQCIHDKIVGTVVIDERAERVPGAWQEAWGDMRKPERKDT